MFCRLKNMPLEVNIFFLRLDCGVLSALTGTESGINLGFQHFRVLTLLRQQCYSLAVQTQESSLSGRIITRGRASRHGLVCWNWNGIDLRSSWGLGSTCWRTSLATHRR